MLASGWLASDPLTAARAHRRPLFAFAAFAVGLWLAGPLGDLLPIDIAAATWLAAACTCAALAMLVTGRACKVVLLAGVLSAGLGWSGVRLHEVPTTDLALIAGVPHDVPSGRIVTVHGVARTAAEPSAESRGAMAPFAHFTRSTGGSSFTLDVRAVRTAAGMVRASGEVRVLLPSVVDEISPGGVYEVRGVYRSPGPAMNPGAFDMRALASQRGEAGVIAVASESLVKPLGPGPIVDRARGAWSAWLTGVQQRAVRTLRGDDEQELSPGRALLLALCLGEDEPAIDQTRTAFARQGLAHMLALSGFHLAVVAGLGLALIRLTGDRGWLEPTLVAGLVLAYLLLVPAEAPIMRAGILVLGLLAAEAFGRRHDRLNALAVIGIALLIVRPLDIASLGFQLSFGITAALVRLSEPVHQRLFGLTLDDRYERPDVFGRRWWLDSVKRLTSASLTCWVIALPVVITRVGVVGLVGVPATVLVVPAITLVLGLGVAAVAVGFVWPGAGAALAAGAAWLGDYITIAVRALDRVPGTAWSAPALSGAWALAACGALVWWMRAGLPVRRASVWVISSLVLIWAAGERLGPRLWGPDVRIDALAVGDGTCIVVRSRGEVLLWDCGSLNPSLGEWELPRAMRTLGVGRIDRVIVTHANFDHYSALPDVLRRVPADEVLVTPQFVGQAEDRSNGGTAFVLNDLRERGVGLSRLSAGDVLTVGDCRAEVLWPPADASPASVNDSSLVVRLTTSSGASVLLTGDIQASAMRVLLEGGDVAADILELPHHGSSHAVARDFVE
ncbi:MAG: ComEC/Rec2 family competence protein, partial [Planctomycetota bacterium]